MTPKRYAPKIAELLTLHGQNYRALMRLLSQARRYLGEQKSYRWHHISRPIELKLMLIEQTKYTERVLLLRKDHTTESLTLPEIELRVYHDAQLAEVLSGQRFSRFLPVYPYPNQAMLQRDEKYQANQFVAELLGQFQHREWQLDCSQENLKP